MHNRDIIWVTERDERIKIRDLSSVHLSNIQNFIKTHKSSYRIKYGKKGYKYLEYNIKQELRLRKLNRLDIDSKEGDLF
jgi:hypothetical protein